MSSLYEPSFFFFQPTGGSTSAGSQFYSLFMFFFNRPLTLWYHLVWSGAHRSRFNLAFWWYWGWSWTWADDDRTNITSIFIFCEACVLSSLRRVRRHNLTLSVVSFYTSLNGTESKLYIPLRNWHWRLINVDAFINNYSCSRRCHHGMNATFSKIATWLII